MKALVLPLILLASPALADDLIFFRSPSANIQCMIATGDYPAARCDVMQVTKLSYPVQPADCDLDWAMRSRWGRQARARRPAWAIPSPAPMRWSWAMANRLSWAGFAVFPRNRV